MKGLLTSSWSLQAGIKGWSL